MRYSLTKQEAITLLLNDEYANWTYEGAEAVVDYLEQLEQDTEQEIEFDRVAIRCAIHEYENEEELVRDFGKNAKEIEEEGLLIARLKNGHFVVLG